MKKTDIIDDSRVIFFGIRLNKNDAIYLSKEMPYIHWNFFGYFESLLCIYCTLKKQINVLRDCKINTSNVLRYFMFN